MRGNEVFEHGKSVAETRFNGDFDLFTLRVDHESAHTRKLLDLVDRTARARIRHHPDGVELIARALRFENGSDFVRRVVPHVDHGVVTLFFFEQTARVFFGDLGDLLFRVGDDRLFFVGDLHIEYRRRERGERGILVTAFLDRVEHGGRLGRITRFEARFDDFGKMLFADRARTLDRIDKFGGKLEFQIILGHFAFDEIEILRHAVVIDDSADRRFDHTRYGKDTRIDVARHEHSSAHAVVGYGVLEMLFVRQRFVEFTHGQFHRTADVNFILTVHFLELVAHERLVERSVHGRDILLAVLRKTVVFVVLAPLFLAENGKVVRADNHILRGAHDRLAVGKLQDIVCGQHEEACFRLRLDRKRKVNRHLVAVEVGVERSADEGRNLDRSALDEHRLERLNGQTVQRRRTVQKHGVFFNDLFEHVPNEVLPLFDGALCTLDVMAFARFHKLFHDERLEKLDRHFLGQTALVNFEFGSDNDNRTPRIVDALAEQVLTEPTLLAAEQARKRFQLAVGRSAQRFSPSAVVDKRVHRFLQHALFVFNDHFGRTQFDHAF